MHAAHWTAYSIALRGHLMGVGILFGSMLVYMLTSRSNIVDDVIHCINNIDRSFAKFDQAAVKYHQNMYPISVILRHTRPCGFQIDVYNRVEASNSFMLHGGKYCAILSALYYDVISLLLTRSCCTAVPTFRVLGILLSLSRSLSPPFVVHALHLHSVDADMMFSNKC